MFLKVLEIILLSLLAVGVFVMYMPFLETPQTEKYWISNGTIHYHVNDAHAHELSLLPYVQYTFKHAEEIDISFERCNITLEDLKENFPTPWSSMKKIKINFTDVPIGNEGAIYMLDLIGEDAESLQLHLERIEGNASILEMIKNKSISSLKSLS